MNIAIFASAFYPHVGGVEECCRQLAHSLIYLGHRCIIITNRWPQSLPSQEDYEGITVFRVPMKVPVGKLGAELKYCIQFTPIRRRIIGILREHQVSMLHVQCVGPNGHYALAAKRELDLPLVVTTQGERTMDAGRLYQRSEWANRRLLELVRESEFITACSHDTLADLEQWYGESLRQRARVVYNGIRLSDFDSVGPFRHPRPYVLAMGRLVPQKGFDALLSAFARASTGECDLIIAGEGPERQRLGQLSGELGLGDRVVFHGRADRPTAVALFKGCEFFVLPSRMEPQGIVNLEAMAAGKAIVTARVGGVPEIVRDGREGLLVPPDDPEALANAMRQMAGDGELRKRLGEAGRRRAAEFQWTRIAETYCSIYESARVRMLRRRAVEGSNR